MLTLTYSGAAMSTLLATFSALAVVAELFGLWTGKSSTILLLAGYTGIVTGAVAAVLFSVLAFLLYKKVTKDVAAHTDYITTVAYHGITNSFFALLVAAFILIVAQLIAILISSLLLIGTSADIGGMYLNQFLPGVIAAGVVGFVGFMAFKIMKGKNFSTIMTVMLMSLAGALLLAVLITVPIKAHTSAADSAATNPSMYDYEDYFKTYYNTNN